MSNEINYQINFLQQDETSTVVISNDDVDAYNKMKEVLGDYFAQEYPLHIVTCYDEFVDWINWEFLNDHSIYEFEGFLRDDDRIEWLGSPEENNKMISILVNNFMKYQQGEGSQEQSASAEELITLNGKRYKLVEVPA